MVVVVTVSLVEEEDSLGSSCGTGGAGFVISMASFDFSGTTSLTSSSSNFSSFGSRGGLLVVVIIDGTTSSLATNCDVVPSTLDSCCVAGVSSFTDSSAIAVVAATGGIEFNVSGCCDSAFVFVSSVVANCSSTDDGGGGGIGGDGAGSLLGLTTTSADCTALSSTIGLLSTSAFPAFSDTSSAATDIDCLRSGSDELISFPVSTVGVSAWSSVALASTGSCVASEVIAVAVSYVNTATERSFVGPQMPMCLSQGLGALIT